MKKTFKIIRARFKGQTGSMGFVKDNSYELTITERRHGNIIIADGDTTCEYETIISFLDNWDKVQSVHKIVVS